MAPKTLSSCVNGFQGHSVRVLCLGGKLYRNDVILV